MATFVVEVVWAMTTIFFPERLHLISWEDCYESNTSYETNCYAAVIRMNAPPINFTLFTYSTCRVILSIGTIGQVLSENTRTHGIKVILTLTKVPLEKSHHPLLFHIWKYVAMNWMYHTGY